MWRWTEQLETLQNSQADVIPSAFYGANIAARSDFKTEDELRAKGEENHILEMSWNGNTESLAYIRTMVEDFWKKNLNLRIGFLPCFRVNFR